MSGISGYRIQILRDRVCFDFTAEIEEMSLEQLRVFLSERLDPGPLLSAGLPIEPLERQFLEHSLKRIKAGIRPTMMTTEKPAEG